MNVQTGRSPRRGPYLGISTCCALMALALLAAGCSSAPDPPDRILDTQNRAAQLAGYGNNYFSRGQYRQALLFFELSLRENLSIDYLPGIAQSHSSIGRVHLAHGALDDARFHFEEAHQIAISERSHRLLIQSYTNLGELLLHEGDDSGARRQFEQGIELVSAQDTSLPAAVLYHNLASLEHRQSNAAEARRLVELARAINRASSRWEELAANYSLMAAIESRAGHQELALEHAYQALEHDKRMENSTGIAQDLAVIARIYGRMERPEEAHRYYRRAYHVYASLRLDERAIQMLEALEGTATLLGEPERAAYYRELRRIHEPR